MELCKKTVELTGDYFYLIFRVVVGLMFFMHGAKKLGLFGGTLMDGYMLYVGIFEALTGLGIAVGILTRMFAKVGIVLMLGAWFVAHAPKGWNPMSNGGELAIMYLVAFLVIHNLGSQRFGFEKAVMKKECF